MPNDTVTSRKKDRATSERFGVLTYITSDLSNHRWRTILTIIGIAVPIAFFILFAALGEGLDQYIISESNQLNKKSYEEMSNIVNAWTDVLLIIIAIMIITSITNTILISSSERKFEFGVLKAIGINQQQIVYLILLEAFIISAIALLVGIIIGFWSAIIFDYLVWLGGGTWIIFAPAKITIESIIFASVLTLIIGTVTALYPALSISKLKTIDILRYE